MSEITRDDIISFLLPVRGVGQATATAIADAFGTDLDALRKASNADLLEVDGIGVTTARAVRKRLRVLESHGLHIPVEALEHDEKRKNIPTDQLSQLVDLSGDGEADVVLYPRDPELDPQLVWQGKDHQDGDDLAVPAVPIYIQDKVVPQAIIENLRETAQEGREEPELSLFDDFDGLPDEAIFDFYQYDANWSNRMILGDALVAMTSLAEKENLKGTVQTIYVDPPYGINFSSNWQVSTRNNRVNDRSDISRQPEQVRAFRDTWKNGIHSYLNYLRDRLQVAHTLLDERGSIFVQISSENVHVIKCLLDEIFGPENAMSLIAYRTKIPLRTTYLASTHDYVIWYAKNKDRVKYRKLFQNREVGAGTQFNWVELPDGTRKRLSEVEGELPNGTRYITMENLVSAGRTESCVFPVEIDGRTHTPPSRKSWKTNPDGMEKLRFLNRVAVPGNTPRYVFYADDYPVQELANVWSDVAGARDKVYVVQTTTKVVERCLLMTTDPGDLVLDPTCGSGTTAYVAESWGRRWITIDTSRVALALARARIMGARYPYWLLADTPEGARAEAEELGRDVVLSSAGYNGDVKKGFVYRRVPHITMGSLTNNPDIEIGMTAEEVEAAIRRHVELEVIVDQPREDTRKVRVAGPFTVESLSPHRTIDPTLTVSGGNRRDSVAANGGTESPRSSEDFGQTVISNLVRAGVQNGYRNERLKFDMLEPYADGGWVAATGTYTDSEDHQRLVAVSVGPEHGTVGREQVGEAAREAVKVGADLVLVCGFAFDGGATDEAADATEREFPVVGERRFGRVRVLNVRINADLMMDDELKATGSGNLFMVFGEPDIGVEENDDGMLQVTLQGVDVYDPVTNEVRSSGAEDAMAWFIDTDYDENQFFVRQAYFTGDPAQYDPYSQLKRALNTEIDDEAWSRLHATTSIPFRKPSTGKIAVKVINHYGDEVLKVYRLEQE